MTEENNVDVVKVYVNQNEILEEKLNAQEFDYTQIKDGAKLLTTLEDDGTRWASAFAQFYKQKYDLDINVEFAFIWFANVIEGSWDHRKNNLIKRLEDYLREDDTKLENVLEFVRNS